MQESVQVWTPPAGQHGLFVCALLRTVRPAEDGAPLASLVHANPYACLNAVVAGRVHAGSQPLPANFVVGPLTAPLETAAHGPLRSLSLVVQPWVLAPLLGLQARDTVDRIHDLGACMHGFAAKWRDTAASACQTLDEAAFWAALAASLPQPWPAPPELALDILRHQGVAAAAAHTACSERQYRRRFQESVGLGPAAWLRLARWEDAARGIAQAPHQPLGELALDAGYADQAHLSRDTRALAGASPARLREAIHEGGGQWSLRPARVRSVQDRSKRPA